ncbi:hypothetical protein [Cohnella sp. GCM10012308]|uniref:hypothetical protein n=1 Tax=Cohnella sp. GCM10012308 TaxID=3317329 RepID=UPI0036179F85
MNNKVNRYLFYSGTGILVLFVVGVIFGALLFAKTSPYTVNIYGEKPDRHLVEIKDPNHLVNFYGYNIPDKRVNLDVGTYYVLLKKKSREILLITDDVEVLNKRLDNKS